MWEDRLSHDWSGFKGVSFALRGIIANEQIEKVLDYSSENPRFLLKKQTNKQKNATSSLTFRILGKGVSTLVL